MSSNQCTTRVARFSRTLAIATGLLLVVAACGNGAGSSGEEDVVKIGVLASRSGDYSAYGLGAEGGIKHVVKEINANGGIKSLNGAKIELVVADTASDPSTAASEARRLIDQEDVSMILGPSTTPEAQAVVPVTERAGVPTLGLETTSVWGENYFYIVSILAEQLGESYAEFVDFVAQNSDEDIQNVVITYPQNDYGIQNAKAAEARLGELGYNVLDAIEVDPLVEDYTPTLLRVRRQDPDAVISILYSRDGQLYHDARFNLGYHDPIFVCGVGGCDSEAVWDALDPKVAKATLANRTFSESLMNPNADLAGLKDLLASAQGKVDVPLDQHFVIGAQGARLMQAAVEEAGSTDREELNDAMSAIEIPAGSDHLYLPGALEGIRYEEGAIPGATALFNQWTDEGELQVVFPPEVAQADPLTESRLR